MEKLLVKFDNSIEAKKTLSGKITFLINGGAPDGDYSTHLPYSPDLNKHRRDCGFGLYNLLSIKKEDKTARMKQVRYVLRIENCTYNKML